MTDREKAEHDTYRPVEVAVATHVMGDTRDGGAWVSADGVRHWDNDDGPCRYARNMTDAWRVVELMRSLGYEFHSLSRPESNRVPGGVPPEYRYFVAFMTTGRTGFANAASMPEAVCRAALDCAETGTYWRGHAEVVLPQAVVEGAENEDS